MYIQAEVTIAILLSNLRPKISYVQSAILCSTTLTWPTAVDITSAIHAFRSRFRSVKFVRYARESLKSSPQRTLHARW